MSLWVNPRANLAIMALPSLALGTAVAAVFMRMTRSSLLEVMREAYIRTARAKGVAEARVVWIHALRNSLIPLITVVGVQMGYLLGGAIVTEEVFTLPGMGRLDPLGGVSARLPLGAGNDPVRQRALHAVNLAVDLSMRPWIRGFDMADDMTAKSALGWRKIVRPGLRNRLVLFGMAIVLIWWFWRCSPDLWRRTIRPK